ncbi:MAG: preprotein translocase subunit SecE [Candidatus Pacebacteria bacterium]|nr:preprotein translocase subunit SecE [Candidatus Paceibacterota bacterium]
MSISNGVEKIKLFFKEVYTEGKKVDWPTKQETFKYTAIVLGISAGAAIFLGALDFGFVKLIGKFIF